MSVYTDADIAAFLTGELSAADHQRMLDRLPTDAPLRARVARAHAEYEQRTAPLRNQMDAWGTPGGPLLPLPKSCALPRGWWLIPVLLAAAVCTYWWTNREAPDAPPPVAPLVVPTPLPDAPPVAEAPPPIAAVPKPEPIPEPKPPTPRAPSIKRQILAAYQTPMEWNNTVRSSTPATTDPLNELHAALAARRPAAAARLLEALPTGTLPTELEQRYRAHLAFLEGRYAESAAQFDAVAAALPDPTGDGPRWYGLLAATLADGKLTPPLRARLDAYAAPENYHSFAAQAAALRRELGSK